MLDRQQTFTVRNSRQWWRQQQKQAASFHLLQYISWRDMVVSHKLMITAECGKKNEGTNRYFTERYELHSSSMISKG